MIAYVNWQLSPRTNLLKYERSLYVKWMLQMRSFKIVFSCIYIFIPVMFSQLEMLLNFSNYPSVDTFSDSTSDLDKTMFLYDKNKSTYIRINEKKYPKIRSKQNICKIKCLQDSLFSIYKQGHSRRVLPM